MRNINKKGTPNQYKFSKKDLDFIVNAAAPDAKDKGKLKRYINEDVSFREGMVGSEKLFKKVISSEQIFLEISPKLLFEVFIRKTKREFSKKSWAYERIGSTKVPVFGLEKTDDFLTHEMIDYLSSMLASFTKIESNVIMVKVRDGVWRKVKYSDIEVNSLKRILNYVEEERKLIYYKRIADVCLFLLGIFPEYLVFDYKYPSGKLRPKVPGKLRRSSQNYEQEGKRFYELASKHEKAYGLDLDELFSDLSENFSLAKRVLDFVSQHYLEMAKDTLFDMED
ncbi:MAG: hypothetical protein ACQEP2_05330 [Actinomycetota bacterium]